MRVLRSIGPWTAEHLAPLLWDSEWLLDAVAAYHDWESSISHHVGTLNAYKSWYTTPIHMHPSSAAVMALHGLFSAILEDLGECSNDVDFNAHTHVCINPPPHPPCPTFSDHVAFCNCLLFRYHGV